MGVTSYGPKKWGHANCVEAELYTLSEIRPRLFESLPITEVVRKIGHSGYCGNRCQWDVLSPRVAPEIVPKPRKPSHCTQGCGRDQMPAPENED